MIKKLLSLFLIAIFEASFAFTATLDRYGGYYDYSSTPTYKWGIPNPKVNDFEYRSIFDDIVAIDKSSAALSDCARWKAINVLLETRIDPYLTMPPGVYRSTVPFDLTRLSSACVEGKPLPFK